MTKLPHSSNEVLDRVSMLRKYELFKDLTIEELATLNLVTTKIQVAKHQLIYDEHDTTDFIYFLTCGTVKIGNSRNDGREVIKTIIHPVTIFGELGLTSQVETSSFAIAMESKTEVYKIGLVGFTELMKSNFDFNIKVIEILGRKIINFENRLESLIVDDARTRIIGFIKENTAKFGVQIGHEMLLKHSLTQQDIANFTGTSRQTVTSVLNDLQSSNQIYFKRKSILIRDISSLA